MGLSLVTPPSELLTLSDAKGHLRVLDASEDSTIQSYLSAAESSVEAYLGRSVLTQRWKYTLDAFPCDDCIRLPRPNLIEVVSVKYIDAAGVQQTWDPSNYVAVTDSLPGEVALAYGIFWPLARYQRNAIEIVYDAGYGSADDVPENIKAAVLLVMADLYRSRESTILGETVADNPTVKNLLVGFRYREAA